MFSPHFLAILESISNFEQFEKKLQPHSLSNSEIIHSKKWDYLNSQQVLFQNTFRQSTFWRVPNTAEVCSRSLLSISYNILIKIELENVPLSQIWNFRIVCLKYWLPIPSILNKIPGIYRNQLKCIYLKNLTFLLMILLHF